MFDEPSYYTHAAVCRRGHVETTVTADTEVSERCPTCGARVLTACPNCGARIRGTHIVPGFIGGGEEFTPPDFCDHCSAPFPWVGRRGRIYELMNLLEAENLDPATELEVREQLEALIEPLEPDEQRRRWEKVRAAAPGLWQHSGAREILTTVISAAAKHGLGL